MRIAPQSPWSQHQLFDHAIIIINHTWCVYLSLSLSLFFKYNSLVPNNELNPSTTELSPTNTTTNKLKLFWAASLAQLWISSSLLLSLCWVADLRAFASWGFISRRSWLTHSFHGWWWFCSSPVAGHARCEPRNWAFEQVIHSKHRDCCVTIQVSNWLLSWLTVIRSTDSCHKSLVWQDATLVDCQLCELAKTGKRESDTCYECAIISWSVDQLISEMWSLIDSLYSE